MSDRASSGAAFPRILVYGAGAIGGFLGALLAEAGNDVTLLARGAQHHALSSRGLRVEWADGRVLDAAPRTLKPGEKSKPFDLIFVTLKCTQLAAAAADIARLLAPGGSLVMIQNGLPWWYFERHDSRWSGTRLESLDPGQRLAKAFDLDSVIGAVIYRPVTLRAPGQLYVPDVAGGDKLVIGEVDNRLTERLRGIGALVEHAGFPVEISADIRAAKWRKLMLNILWNPLCSLTQSAPGQIASVPLAAQLVAALLHEGAAVAQSVGVDAVVDAAAELQRVAGNLRQQPSMLQDVRCGRPLEWQAMLGGVIDIAALTGVPVPHLAAVTACIAVLDQRIRLDGAAFSPVATSNATSLEQPRQQA